MFGKERALSLDKDKVFAYEYALTFDFATDKEKVQIKNALLEAIRWGKNIK